MKPESACDNPMWQFEPKGDGKWSKLTISINNIETTRHGTDDHPTDLKRKEHQRHGPAKLAHEQAISRDAPTEGPHDAKDELRDDQDDPELGLIDAAVPARQDPGRPVGQPAGDDEAQDRADEGTRVGVAGLHLVPPERGAEEGGAEDHADEDGPADQGALDEAGPQERGLEEEGEGTQGELPEGVIGLAAVEEGQGLEITGFGRHGSPIAHTGRSGVSMCALLPQVVVIVLG